MKAIYFHFIRSTLFVWALLCSIGAAAQVSLTINVSEPGTLNDQLTEEQKQSVTDIKVTGNINNDDVDVLAEMTREHSLANIDMSNSSLDGGSIRESEFYYCEGLRNIKLPKDVVTIENRVFWHCHNLETCLLPETLERIEYEAFSAAYNLHEIILPATIKFIGGASFWGAPLDRFVCKAATRPEVNEYIPNYGSHIYVFDNGLTSNSVLVVPDINEYYGQYPWDKFPAYESIDGKQNLKIRFSTGAINVPSWIRSSNESWDADTWVVWGEPISEEHTGRVGNPPTDSKGRQWYEYDYELTSRESDILPDGKNIIWEKHTAPFGRGRKYDYFPNDYTPGDIYLRRTFIVNSDKIPTKLVLACAYDDPWAQFYINGTLVYESPRWECFNGLIELTPEQIALIHFDGKPNILAAHCEEGDGDYYIDCGLYDPETINYHLTSNTTCELTNAPFAAGELTIPEKVSNGNSELTVTRICENAFRETGVTKITLPATVENIDNWAFWNCGNLQSVVIPENVKRIGYEAFQHCRNLQTVVLPDNVDIDRGAFGECENAILIANRVIYMYDEGDGRLMCAPKNSTEFEVPAGVHSIYSAFYDCTQLTSVTLGQTVERLVGKAFGNCTSLRDIYVSGKIVPEISDNCFEGTDKSKITLHIWASQLAQFKERWGEEFKYEVTTDVEPMSLAINVEEAGSLRELIAAETGKTAGASAFDIKSIKVTGNVNHDDLRYLGGLTRGYYMLSDIDLSEATINEKSIPNECFRDNDKLASIILPETLEEIGWAAFYNNNALTAIHIPASVKAVRGRAFQHCDNLETVTGAEGVNTHGLSCDDGFVFWECYKLTEPIYSSKVFMYMPINMTGSYEVQPGIVSLMPGSMICSKISSITLPASLQEMGDDCFESCINLTEIHSLAMTPPLSYSDVWDQNFNRAACTVYAPAASLDDYKNASDWRNLGNFLPIAVGELIDNFTIEVATAGGLNDEMFDAAVNNAGIDKTLISKLTVTGSINSDDWNWLMNLNSTCYYLSALDMSGATISGITSIDRDMAALMNYKFIALPEGITVIEREAFRYKNRLQEISLPQSLATIGAYAFANSSIIRLVIPDNVTEMGDRVFQESKSLTYLEFGHGMTYIAECMTEGANSLETIVLKNVQNLGWCAFRSAYALKDVYCYMKIAPWGDDIFRDIELSNVTLHVAKNKTGVYQGWYNFGTIAGDLPEMPEVELAVALTEAGTMEATLTAAVNAAGVEMYDIDKIVVTGPLNNDDFYTLRNMCRESVVACIDISGADMLENYLPADAFAELTRLRSVVLPEGLQYIHSYAFRECYSLEQIHIPASVKRICEKAFRNCSALTSVTGCEGLTECDVWNDWDIFESCTSLVEPVYGGKVFLFMPFSKTGEYVMPDGIITMSPGSMRNTRLSSLTLPASLETIGRHAFHQSYSLTSITSLALMPPTCIDGSPWDDGLDKSKCTLYVPAPSLEAYKNADYWKDFTDIQTLDIDYIDFAINVETAGTLNDEMFDAATAKVDKTLISKLKVTGSINADDWTWLMNIKGTAGCYNIASLDLSGAVTTEDFTAITNELNVVMPYSTLVMPEGIKRLEDDAFREKSRLQNITLPQSLEFIGHWAFAWSGITSLYIPGNVKEVRDRACEYAYSLKRVEFGEGLTYVSESFAREAFALEEIVLPMSMQTLHGNAFERTKATQVYCYAKLAPNSWAFSDVDLSKATLHVAANKLERYQNADAWKDFGTIVGDLPAYPEFDITVNISDWNTFNDDLAAAMVAVGCDDKMDIVNLTVTGNLSHDDVYAIRNNVRGVKKLDISRARLHDFTVPYEGFRGTGYESVILPESITSIDSYAFWGCQNLTEIDIPANVEYIGDQTFYGCSNLTAVTGGEGIIYHRVC